MFSQNEGFSFLWLCVRVTSCGSGVESNDTRNLKLGDFKPGSRRIL